MENAQLPEVFKKVASCLSGNWVYSQLESNHREYWPYLILVNQDNLSERLIIRTGHATKEKVSASLDIQTEFLGLPKRSVYGTTNINISPKRSPQSLAKDIERRLLPAAREEVRDTLERMEIAVEQNKTSELKKALVNKLFPITGRQWNGRRAYDCSICFGSFQLENYQKEVRGEFIFSFEEFLAICHLMKAMREGQ